MKKVSIIGGGIGGLCTAIRLLNKGYKVSIFEKERSLGGKINIKKVKNARFDLSASILMTPDIYTDIFREVGKNYKDYFEIINIDPLYNVYYDDNSNYKFYSNLGEMTKECENIQKNLSVEYISFLSKSLQKYLISNKEFLNKYMLKKEEIYNMESIKNFLEVRPFQTTQEYLKKNISNEKLMNYFLFQSMYIGINPYKHTNLYSIIPAISHTYGFIYVKGGFYRYIQALEKLIIEMGGKIYKNTKVERIIKHKNKVTSIEINNKKYKTDIVVCNADYEYGRKKLLLNKKIKAKKTDYSCSVFMMYLGLNKKFENLEVHNMYLNKNFKESIQQPFKGELSQTPSIYMYYPSKVDDSVNGEFESILNLMVRVPNTGFGDIVWNKETVRKYRDIVIEQIKKIRGLEDIQDYIKYESYITPIQFEKRFNCVYGNCFGISHKLSKMGYFRPHIKDKKIENMYYIGSSTHPGNGVSVIIEASKMVCEIIEDNSGI